jgi:alkanesulfonate monooxygenase SsuD/methylene tetrahydromethanopterin reductase-like flavin-dependent oxidoreductase (luciferase family)
MRMGVSLWANNGADNERFVALEKGQGSAIGDGVDNSTYESEIKFGDLVEPLGFDSLWTVEHHFNPYTMIPDPLQFLSFWAGRTERIGVGTMVTVLPWHQPVRVAEQISLLQHFMGDREMMIGFGRGLGRREYGGLDVAMDESRERFDEAVHIIKGLLANERFGYQGKFTRVPDVAQRPESTDISIRPRPRDSKALLDNFYVAWGSPTSVKLTAHLGLRPLIIPQREFSFYVDELAEFNELRMGAGYAADNCTLLLQCYCAPTEEKAQEGVRYFLKQSESAGINYEFGNDTIMAAKGYEYYAEMTKQAAAQGIDRSQPTLYNEVKDAPIGTPEHCIAAIRRVVDQLHPNQILGVFKIGSMPYELAQASLKLFAQEVLPAVHDMVPQAPIQLAAELRGAARTGHVV